MKTLILTLAISVMSAQVAWAEKVSDIKLIRGVTNVVTAPFEIPKQTRAYWIEGAYITDHIIAWAFSGFVWGGVQTVKRAGSGLWDIVSFPFDKPADNEPLLKPDYVFEDWPSDPDVFIFKKKTNE